MDRKEQIAEELRKLDEHNAQVKELWQQATKTIQQPYHTIDSEKGKVISHNETVKENASKRKALMAELKEVEKNK